MGKLILRGFLRIAAAAVVFTALPFHAQIRVIELLADKDSRYKIGGTASPEITLTAGEQILLRVTARR